MAAHGLLSLDDPRSQQVDLAGAKAAGLARAAAAGLPVLPGVVVTTPEASRHVLDVVRPLAAQGRLGRLRRAAMAVEPDTDLVTQLRDAVAALGSALIVRSSSPLEGDGVWSGAFSSLVGVSVDDLPTALRACWGSAWSPDAMERAEHAGVALDDLALAVLVQPELRPDLGGTARVRADGHVMIAATDGPLRALMEGWVEGRTASVTAADVRDDGGLPSDVVQTVADLARATRAALGHDLIEWASVGRDVHLLQAMTSRVPPGAVSVEQPSSAHGTPTAVRVAMLAHRFPGPLGEELVLPWAVSCRDALGPAVAPARDALDPKARLARVRSTANALVAQLWGGGSPRSARESALRTFRQLRGTDPEPALRRIEALRAPSAGVVDALRADLARLESDVAGRGLLAPTSSLWQLTLEQVDDLVAGRPVVAADRLGVGRWEPFLHAVVQSTGQMHRGTPVAAGAGAGPVHVVDDIWRQEPPRGRYVLVATSPIPPLSPLLWNAAALVTRGGSAAAHLLEFAGAIGVPSVIGVSLPPLHDDGWFAAVDGDSGVVAMARLGPAG